MMQLTKREMNLLVYLLGTTDSVTTKELAEAFDVSIRTIKYDIDNIRSWLKERDIELHAQRSKGLWFDLTETQRLQLKSELFDVARFELYSDQSVRVTKITWLLLLAENYLTAQKIADLLGVTKNTILADFDKVEEFLERYQLTLVRRSGYGFLISGEEEASCRYLMEYILHQEVTEYDIYKIMNQLIHKPRQQSANIQFGKNTLFQEVYEVTLRKTSGLLAPALLEQFNYAEILAITFRVTIAICRMSIHKTLGSYQLLPNQEKLLEKEDFPFLLMKKVFQEFELPVLEAEYVYIYSDYSVEVNQQDIVEVTKELITSVSEELAIPFTKDTQLFTNLFAHLSLRLVRKHTFMNEYNPFLEDIRLLHPELFQAISSACERIMSDFSILLNDSFVAYIALHFLVSIEKERQEQSVIRIVYVCSTGLGVTNLIQQKIQEEIPNAEIVSFASVLNANEVIETKHPDLVISIFPIEGLGCPLVKVNPLPTKENIQTIKETIQKITDQGIKREKTSFNVNDISQKQSNAEDLTRDVLVNGYVMYEELMTLFKGRLKTEYHEAFLLHVFLMVHRIMFQGQYDCEGNILREVLLTERSLVTEIEQLFSKRQLSINQAEIVALLQYIELDREAKTEGKTIQRSRKMKLSEDAKAMIVNSEFESDLSLMVEQINQKLNKLEMYPTELQWTILINHLDEMYRRSKDKEKILAVDSSLFSEVSEVSKEIAQEVVNEIGNLSPDEVYILSIHFESVKNN